MMLALAIGTSMRAEHPTEHPTKKEHSTKTQQKKNDVQVVGVLFYADWCGSCKVLEPKITAVQQEYADQPVLFTRLDLTDDATKAHSARYAEFIGFGDVYEGNQDGTGYMLLVDANGKRVLGRLTKDDSENAIRDAINQALAKTGKGKSTNSEHPKAKAEKTKSEHPKSEHPSR